VRIPRRQRVTQGSVINPHLTFPSSTGRMRWEKEVNGEKKRLTPILPQQKAEAAAQKQAAADAKAAAAEDTNWSKGAKSNAKK
jgi:hypothetical protein